MNKIVSNNPNTQIETNKYITIFWGAGAAAFSGYRTFQTFPELFWPTREKRSVLQITEKEESLLKQIHNTLIKRKSATTLDSYLRVIQEYYAITEKLQSETILRDDLDFNHPLLWSNVTELSNRLINLRNAICVLTAKHYNDDPINELFELENNESQHYENSLKQELYNECNNLLDFLYEIHRYQKGAPAPVPVQVFTTNYDVFLEHLFWNAIYKDTKKSKPALKNRLDEWYFDNGFYVDSSTNDVNFLSSDKEFRLHYSTPWYIGAEEDIVQSKNKNIGECFRVKSQTKFTLKINRLHGCVGWIRAQVGDDAVFFSLAQQKMFKSFHDRLCVCYPGHEDSLGNTPHVDSWRKFIKQLNRSDICIIIGFAFRDPDILNAIGRRLEYSKHPLQLIVINPHISSKESLLSRLIEVSKDYCPPLPYWKKLLANKQSISFISSRFPLGKKGMEELVKILQG